MDISPILKDFQHALLLSRLDLLGLLIPCFLGFLGLADEVLRNVSPLSDWE